MQKVSSDIESSAPSLQVFSYTQHVVQTSVFLIQCCIMLICFCCESVLLFIHVL